MRLNVKRKKLAELVPADYNPRDISDAALAGLGASVEQFGYVEPIVWNQQTGNVVGGHQRLKVLLARGAKEADCVVVDLPLEREKALNVALNSPSIAGHFTADLEGLLAEIQQSSAELFEALRFDSIDVDAMLEDARRQVGEDEHIETVDAPQLPQGGRQPFQQMTFTLHDDQAESVKAAIEQAKAAGPFAESPNENSNGNAIARIAEAYLG